MRFQCIILVTSIYKFAETKQDSIIPPGIFAQLETVFQIKYPLDTSLLLYCSLLCSLPENLPLSLCQVLDTVMIEKIMKLSDYLRIYQHYHSLFSSSLKVRKGKQYFIQYLHNKNMVSIIVLILEIRKSNLRDVKRYKYYRFLTGGKVKCQDFIPVNDTCFSSLIDLLTIKSFTQMKNSCPNYSGTCKFLQRL